MDRFREELQVLQGASAGIFHVLNDELEVATPFIKGNPRAQPHLLAVLDLEPDPLVAIAKHGTTHLGALVFEGEIPVTRAGPGQVADLALYPDEVEVPLEQSLHLSVQLAD